MSPRVLHIFSTFDPGGPEVRTANLINRTKDNFRHYILAMDGRYGTLPRVSRDAVAEVLPAPPIVPQQVGHLSAPLRAPAVLWRLLRNAVWVRHQIRRIDPHLLLTYNLGAASALLAARTVGGCPIIHTETGFSVEERARLKTVRVVLRRSVAGHVSALVVPSRALEHIAKSQFGLRAPVIRIPNGVDVRKLKPADGAAMRRQLGLKPSEFVIGCVGHLRAEKGHMRLFEAFRLAAIPDSRLLLLGDGPMRPALERAIAEMGIASRVLFAGTVDDVAPWYAAMDLFALPSDTEQMPMALLEAMSCGLPAVSTDVGDCREILGVQPVPAVFALGDTAGLTDAIRTFSRDAQLCREAGARNRRRCITEYDSEQMLARYLELYNRTISGSSRPGPADTPAPAATQSLPG